MPPKNNQSLSKRKYSKKNKTNIQTENHCKLIEESISIDELSNDIPYNSYIEIDDIKINKTESIESELHQTESLESELHQTESHESEPREKDIVTKQLEESKNDIDTIINDLVI